MVIRLLRHDKQLWKWKTFKDAASFLWGMDGLNVKTFIPLLKFFKPNFHPWDHDTRYLLEQYSKITEEEQLNDTQVQQIDAEFKGCISDIEAVIAANNVKTY
jgi:predicted metal-dependent hydrolase